MNTEKDKKEDKILRAIETATFGINDKFDSAKWTEIERKIDDSFTIEVLTCLKQHALGKEYVNEKRMLVIGEDLYCKLVKNELIKNGLILDYDKDKNLDYDK